MKHICSRQVDRIVFVKRWIEEIIFIKQEMKWKLKENKEMDFYRYRYYLIWLKPEQKMIVIRERIRNNDRGSEDG